MAWDFLNKSGSTYTGSTRAAPSTPVNGGTTNLSGTVQDWLNGLLGRYGGNSGGTGTTPSQNPLGWTQPSTTMSMKDFTNWLYRNMANGAWNTAGGMQGAFDAAQRARENVFNNYSGAVQGYQQAAGDLFGQMRDALGGYNSFDWNNMLATGQVPEATRQYYQQIRDAQVANLQSDLNKQFNETFGPLKERLAASGTWDSTLGSRAVGDLMGETARLMAQGSNAANAQLAQNLVNAPYQMLQGAGQNLGNVLQALGTQGSLASSVFAPMQNQFAMAGDMPQIPAAAYQTYMTPLMNLWQDLLNAETARTIAQEQANAAADATSASNDAAMWSAIGGLIGGLF